MDRLRLFTHASLSAFGLVALVAACSSDPEPASTVQIRNFCTSYAASPAFSCCSAEDRNNLNFRLRYRFGSQAECTDVLTQQATQAEGKQGFDAAAAESCLSYLNSRTCGTLPLANVQKEERQAGCYKVLSGIQAEGQLCSTSDDCQPGLLCPILKETGLSYCSKPASSNQDCIGDLAGSVDHPACGEDLICSFIVENPPSSCPTPPCRQYKCVPPFEKDDPCTGTECGEGLVCREFTCQSGAPGGAGAGCRVPEHCGEGLYCDTAIGKCSERKADGAPCNDALNPFFECKGICAGGTCASFCGQ
ncbi:MAG: hypothetical protein U0270_08160 [Labilithrix sp.]